MADAPALSRNLEAVVASMVGLLALFVSGYTAFIQRQQVRAQVLPLLEYGTSNAPALTLSVANKGVGPARIESVVVTIDGAPIHDWTVLHEKFFRHGEASYSTSMLTKHVLSPGEEIAAYTLTDKDGKPLGLGDKGSPGEHFNRERFRVGLEICYCSTLDDCWTLVAQPHEPPQTTPIARCPALGPGSFHD